MACDQGKRDSESGAGVPAGRAELLVVLRSLTRMARLSRATRVLLMTVLLAASLVPAIAGRAVGEESAADLKAEMSAIQSRLDAATARIVDLHRQAEDLEHRMEVINHRLTELKDDRSRLMKAAKERAAELYMSGGTETLEILFGSADLTQLTDRATVLSKISIEDDQVFVELARSQDEMTRLNAELASSSKELEATLAAIKEEAAVLQAEFDEASDEYERLQELAARAPAPAPVAAAAAPVPSAPVRVSGNMTCPVAGPVSFVDSWGAPRAGHTHQGVDMMAAAGTPVVAITSGTITYSGYGDSAGYWQILSGDDGNGYWYMHNQSNIVNGGHVSAGQQIATVGDTGNAAGTPHLHFEYHPGGGAAVNPYPLVAGLC